MAGFPRGFFFRRFRRWLLRLLGIVLFLLVVILARAATLLSASPPTTSLASSGGWRGALHVHSSRSDGRAEIPAIARHARAAGLDFLLLGDHNLAPAAPARVAGVLIIPGVELSTPDGHVLAYGGTTVAAPELRRDDPLGAARASGPLVVLSHPVNRRRPWSGPFRGADAMEVLSADSAYRSALGRPSRLLLAAIAYPVSPEVGLLTLLDGFDEARARFRQALARHELGQGFCGHDAHGLPAYEPIFRVLRTHLLVRPAPASAPEMAAAEVIAALSEGRFFCSVDGLADASSFTLDLDEKKVRVSLLRPPGEGTVVTLLLYRDGSLQARSVFEDDDAQAPAIAKVEAEARPGRWHAEVEIDRPWLLGRRRFLWILSGVRTLP